MIATTMPARGSVQFCPLVFIIHLVGTFHWEHCAAASGFQLVLDICEGFVVLTRTLNDGICTWDGILRRVLQRSVSPLLTDAANYYAIGLHELIYWSGGKSRLDHVVKGRFGTENCTFEELIAEIGSTFLMVDLGIVSEVLHKSNIVAWLKALKNDKRYILKPPVRHRTHIVI